MPTNIADSLWHPTSENVANSGQEPCSLRTIARALSSVMVVLLALSMLLSIYEGTFAVPFPRLATLAIGSMGFLWVHYKGTHARAVLLVLALSLMALGLCLLLQKSAAPGDSVLFWFILLPSMLMVSLGLRLGCLLFFIFYAFLALLFFTPLEAYLTLSLAGPIKVRFMLALFGAYFFSCWAELLRHRTHDKLRSTLATLEHESRTDPLTGAGNRRDFHAVLPRIMAGCLRTHRPYALALLDIDHFKRVNDTHGHQTGDIVLHHVAATVEEQIRDTDYLFRWGGEEFAVIMPDCDPRQALQACERIRIAVEQTPCLCNEFSVQVTISTGLYCGKEAHNRELPVRTADRRLYRAKTLGRNRVVFRQEVLKQQG